MPRKTKKMAILVGLQDPKIPKSIKNAIKTVAKHEQIKARVADNGYIPGNGPDFRLFANLFPQTRDYFYSTRLSA